MKWAGSGLVEGSTTSLRLRECKPRAQRIVSAVGRKDRVMQAPGHTSLTIS